MTLADPADGSLHRPPASWLHCRPMPRWVRTFLHLSPVVGGVSVASVLGLYLFRRFAPMASLH